MDSSGLGFELVARHASVRSMGLMLERVDTVLLMAADEVNAWPVRPPRSLPLRGFAVVNRLASDRAVAIWTVSAATCSVANTNAVVIEPDDPELAKKLDALTWRQIVTAVPGASIRDLGLACKDVTDVYSMFAVATQDLQAQVVEAVARHRARVRSKVAPPEFDPPPSVALAEPPKDDLAGATLQAANLLGAHWSAWLAADRERLRRTVQPKTGKTPWMMPESLNQPTQRLLPDEIEPLHAS